MGTWNKSAQDCMIILSRYGKARNILKILLRYNFHEPLLFIHLFSNPKCNMIMYDGSVENNLKNVDQS